MKELLSDVRIGFDDVALDSEVPNGLAVATADRADGDSSPTPTVRRAATTGPRRRCPRSGDRLRLIAWSVVGAGCLMAAHRLKPDNGRLFGGPSDPVEWVSLLCGIAGVWLVPGIWLSALFVRIGAGLPAWLGTRIATTLIWYALLGPILHHLGEGAQVTSRGLLIATVAATAAVSLGVALGLSPWSANRWLRFVVPATVGAVCAQAAIAIAMRVWTVDMNYEHIQRLDWLILLVGAGLVTGGTLLRVSLPRILFTRKALSVLTFLAVIALTVGAVQLANSRWSPQQRMPSAFGIEQVLTPVGADVAFVLTAIGPDGPRFIQQAEFVASDANGRTIPVRTRIVGADGVSGQAVLLVTLPADERKALCEPGRSAKVTLRERISGTRIQAVVPARWCGR